MEAYRIGVHAQPMYNKDALNIKARNYPILWIPLITSNFSHFSIQYLDTKFFSTGVVGKLVTFRKMGKWE